MKKRHKKVASGPEHHCLLIKANYYCQSSTTDTHMGLHVCVLMSVHMHVCEGESVEGERCRPSYNLTETHVHTHAVQRGSN